MEWIRRLLGWKPRAKVSPISPISPAVSPTACDSEQPFDPERDSLSSKSSNVPAHALRTAFETLLQEHGDSNLVAAKLIAEHMRGIHRDDWLKRDIELSHVPMWPEDVRKLADHPPDRAVEFLGVASFNRSGFVREVAVRQLAKVNHPRAVPYALLRLSDWVPQVRVAAHELTDALIEGQFAAFIEHARIVNRLARTTRVDLSEVQHRIVARLRRADAQQAVQRGLEHADVAVRRFCFHILENSVFDDEDLLSRVMGDPSNSIRSWFSGAIARRIDDLNNVRLRSLLEIQSGQIRRSILWSLNAAKASELADVVAGQIHTKWKGVREAARHLMRQSGEIDFAARYRARLVSADGVTLGNIAGLGETGDSSDFDFIRPHFAHVRAAVRAAVVTACVGLDRERATPLIRLALIDASGQVRKAAAGALTGRLDDQDWETLLSLLQSDHSNARNIAFRVLHDQPSWDAMPAILWAIASSDDDLVARGWAAMKSWYTRYHRAGWSKPVPRTRVRMAQALARCREKWSGQPQEFPPVWKDVSHWIEEVERSA